MGRVDCVQTLEGFLECQAELVKKRCLASEECVAPAWWSFDHAEKSVRWGFTSSNGLNDAQHRSDLGPGCSFQLLAVLIGRE